jgi:hypothetical protein
MPDTRNKWLHMYGVMPVVQEETYLSQPKERTRASRATMHSITNPNG